MGDLKIKKIDPSQIRYTPEEGEMCQTPEGKVMVWHENSWQEIKLEGGGINMGLYDMNKQIISQLPYMEDFEKAMDDIQTLYGTYHNKYFMLYGKEISYFTVFKIIEPQYLSEEVLACCLNVGPIKAMDLTEAGDAVEIWVQPQDDEPTCLYLFPYDSGIVQVGE